MEKNEAQADDTAGNHGNRLKNKLDSLFFINEFIRFANIVPAQAAKAKVLKVKLL